MEEVKEEKEEEEEEEKDEEQLKEGKDGKGLFLLLPICLMKEEGRARQQREGSMCVCLCLWGGGVKRGGEGGW